MSNNVIHHLGRLHTMNEPSQTAERILVAAEALFERFGPSKTTVVDIAREISLSPASIYKHFDGKNAIFEKVGSRKISILQYEIENIIAQRRPPWSRIENIIFAINRFFDPEIFAPNGVNTIDFFKELINIELTRLNNRWEFIESFHAFTREAIAQLLREGAEAGEFSIDDPDETSAAIFDCFVLVFEPLLVIQHPMAVRMARCQRQLRLLARAVQQQTN